jgi:hypothetical protein
MFRAGSDFVGKSQIVVDPIHGMGGYGTAASGA